MNRAILLDRDGTMIKDKNYLDTPEGVEWYEGVFQALKTLEEEGFRLVMITNQSGVARGYMTEDDVEAIHSRIEEDLEEHGITLDGVYYCPYLEGAKIDAYDRDSDLRKPSPGMILQAADDLDLDLESSFVIGDKLSDVEAGERAGCTSVLVRTGKENDSESINEGEGVTPDMTVDTVAEAVERIVKREH
ncbi:MAG: D-glycero-alpha-D-manno-heptose-1,7-bisphosphate 7-phosphatase [bacterium]